MIPVILVAVLVGGGICAWLAGRWGRALPMVVSLAACGADAVLIALLWTGGYGRTAAAGGRWIAEFSAPWVPQFGITFHLAVDGLSLIMAALTALIGIAAVLCSRKELHERHGFFHFNLLVSLAGIMGVFLAADLFLFYFFWELMLVPMYFLIGIWGHENRSRAAIKFFIYTQAGGLLMFMAILGLYFINGSDSGTYTFEYTALCATALKPVEARLLMAGFLAAFLVKLPALPFHTWLPDAHTEAPTAGSVVLAGLLLKTGAYGLLRFVIPLFPLAVAEFQDAAMAIGVAGILYGALLAFAQTDLKRMVAYTSVSHMGFVLTGVFSMNQLALQGVVIQIVCHAFSTGALFVLAGALQERLGSREMSSMGGFWHCAPRMGGMMLFFALASLGLPGLGNFIGEFLVLAGAWTVNPWIAAAGAVGFILSAVYSLFIMQKIFHGAPVQGCVIEDLGAREMSVLGAMVIALVCIGLYPGPLMDAAAPALDRIRSAADAKITTDASGSRNDPAREARGDR